jgi:hypothetical protein
MADLRCDFCEINPAAFLVGNLETGEQQGACPPDFARLGLQMAKILLPSEEILSVLGINPPADAPADGGAQPGKRGRKSKTAATPEPKPEPAASETLAGAKAPVTDG